mmetsp:Transcript_4606/g.11638  ORF Transcript_4606/g.11638 Transcript_4606/m.11638 type:complete len:240 (-) Transcript_4606:307-1026(-)
MPPPTMFPSVTGSMLLRRNCLVVTSAPASMPWEMRNMLATECSKPSVTKVEMGMKMLRSLPGMLFEAMAIHTARQTSQLHSTPLAKRVVKPIDTLATATLATLAVSASLLVVWARKAMAATKRDPAKFPLKLQNQDLQTSARFTFPVRRPLSMMKTLPVKSSAPVRITIASPAGKPIAPLTKLERPGLLAARVGEEPATTEQSSAPMPMREPARKPSTRVLSQEYFAFAMEVLHADWKT